jgi:hypothetical protein
MGILHEVCVDDPFYDISLEKIAQRVFNNQEALRKKFEKKSASEAVYHELK